jgi:hypothetical protein
MVAMRKASQAQSAAVEKPPPVEPAGADSSMKGAPVEMPPPVEQSSPVPEDDATMNSKKRKRASFLQNNVFLFCTTLYFTTLQILNEQDLSQTLEPRFNNIDNVAGS